MMEHPPKPPGQQAHSSKLVPMSFTLYLSNLGSRAYREALPTIAHIPALCSQRWEGSWCSLWPHHLGSRQSLSFQSDGIRMDQVRESWRRKMEFSLINTEVYDHCRLLHVARSWLSCRGVTPRHDLTPHPLVAHQTSRHKTTATSTHGGCHPVPPAEGAQGWRKSQPGKLTQSLRANYQGKDSVFTNV